MNEVGFRCIFEYSDWIWKFVRSISLQHGSIVHVVVFVQVFDFNLYLRISMIQSFGLNR
jgi:hypothetical protein